MLIACSSTTKSITSHCKCIHESHQRLLGSAPSSVSHAIANGGATVREHGHCATVLTADDHHAREQAHQSPQSQAFSPRKLHADSLLLQPPRPNALPAKDDRRKPWQPTVPPWPTPTLLFCLHSGTTYLYRRGMARTLDPLEKLTVGEYSPASMPSVLCVADTRAPAVSYPFPSFSIYSNFQILLNIAKFTSPAPKLQNW